MIVTIFFILGLLQGLNGAEIQSRIIGGDSPTTVGKYPYVASLQTAQLEHICAATIIDSKWAVTAASCIDNTKPIKYLGVGSDSKTSGVLYSVILNVVHEYFDPEDTTKDYDIAIVKTVDYIKYTTVVKNIPLSGSYLGAGVSLTVIGWGATVVGGTASKTLKVGTLYSITNTQCKDDLTRLVSNNQICATYNGKGACTGDLGSPVVWNGRFEGIVINDTICGTDHDVYTRIYPLISWINDIKRRY